MRGVLAQEQLGSLELRMKFPVEPSRYPLCVTSCDVTLSTKTPDTPTTLTLTHTYGFAAAGLHYGGVIWLVNGLCIVYI